jgi:hypothetical protein
MDLDEIEKHIALVKFLRIDPLLYATLREDLEMVYDDNLSAIDLGIWRGRTAQFHIGENYFIRAINKGLSAYSKCCPTSYKYF